MTAGATKALAGEKRATNRKASLAIMISMSSRNVELASNGMKELNAREEGDDEKKDDKLPSENKGQPSNEREEPTTRRDRQNR